MSGVVWSKFYWSDWSDDPALKLCSLAAQGLWMRMLALAAQHDPIGYVCLAGRPLGVTDLARLTGASETEVGALLAELDRNGVFSRDRQQRIYSRRMVKDAKAAAIARKNGALGGNPSLGKHKGKRPPDNPPVKPRHKTQEPRASSKVEGPIKGPSNLTERESADERADGPSPPRAVVELVWDEAAQAEADREVQETREGMKALVAELAANAAAAKANRGRR